MSSPWPLVPAALPSANAVGAPTFIGKGLSCPLREDPETGDFQRVESDENVRQCLKQGILTVLGERVMAEGVGTIARRLLFEESDVVADLLEPSIKDFVERYEPRVSLQTVSITQDSSSEDMVSFKCRITYVVLATNRRDTLNFPFYLTPSSGG